jgi:hypothetical protein
VPAGGYGRQFDVMTGWLDEHVGRGAYWIGSEAGPGLADGALFYFLGVASVRAFVERFAVWY